jgi:hypothetical protein
MNSKFAVGAARLVATPVLGAQAPGGGAPWFGFGPVDTAYTLTLDTTVAFSGHSSLLLLSLAGADATTWIASHQIVDARPYRGRRVGIRAHLRTEQATAADMWVVVDGFANGKQATLLSDSLVPALRGTTDWQEVSIIFDVSSNAGCVRYGSMLHGTGAVWLDAMSFDTVSAAVPATLHPKAPRPFGKPTTVLSNCRGMMPRPVNLDFEQAP